jgi:hypothetical protein
MDDQDLIKSNGYRRSNSSHSIYHRRLRLNMEETAAASAEWQCSMIGATELAREGSRRRFDESISTLSSSKRIGVGGDPHHVVPRAWEGIEGGARWRLSTSKLCSRWQLMVVVDQRRGVAKQGRGDLLKLTVGSVDLKRHCRSAVTTVRRG